MRGPTFNLVRIGFLCSLVWSISCVLTHSFTGRRQEGSSKVGTVCVLVRVNDRIERTSFPSNSGRKRCIYLWQVVFLWILDAWEAGEQSVSYRTNGCLYYRTSDEPGKCSSERKHFLVPPSNRWWFITEKWKSLVNLRLFFFSRKGCILMLLLYDTHTNTMKMKLKMGRISLMKVLHNNHITELKNVLPRSICLFFCHKIYFTLPSSMWSGLRFFPYVEREVGQELIYPFIVYECTFVCKQTDSDENARGNCIIADLGIEQNSFLFQLD